eukprot:TRINITY_DN2104_c0_g1_i1.p2 TRINITY_DN2104_c0_g1~~TRINITY_DN2104_c0_g1_i1.p2  ORF type:complete len:137 (-),score=89.03 TRINITY_DN2104_c0_g1_i1:114-524(-)
MEDWTTVKRSKDQKPKPKKKAAPAAASSSAKADNTVKKFTAGSNRQHNTGVTATKVEKIASDPDAPMIQPKVSKAVSLEIQKGRQALGLTQKDLATKINEKATVVNDYEAGSAVPNQSILIKMEKALGVKLRGIKG